MLSSAMIRPRQRLCSNLVNLEKNALWNMEGRTFEELAAIDLAGGDLEGNDVALCENES